MRIQVETIRKVGISPKIEYQSAMVVFSIGETILSAVVLVDTPKAAKLFNKAIRTNKMPEVLNMMSNPHPPLIFKLKF